jgi:uncharacterized membrane-anchored protein YhcB (DUF1043 family)
MNKWFIPIWNLFLGLVIGKLIVRCVKLTQENTELKKQLSHCPVQAEKQQ